MAGERDRETGRSGAWRREGYRLLPLVMSIGHRYSAIAIQFVLVILITRRASVAVAGQYFAVFGWINATSVLAGAGLPDGMVREIAHRISIAERDRAIATLQRAALAFVGITLGMLAAGTGVALSLGREPLVVLLVGLMWLGYAVTFFASQILLALGRPGLGGYFNYPALNLSLLFTVVPFLHLYDQPTLAAILIAAVVGTTPTAAVAAALAMRVASVPRGRPVSPAPLGPIFALGWRIALARAAQSALLWIPTWFAGIALAPAAAALVGLAGRLTTAITAIVGAIRFIVRPQIIAALARGARAELARDARRVNTLTMAAVVAAILVHIVAGRMLLVAVFGAAYEAAYVPLMILLIGALIEAAAGIVDELLKMSGHASFVLGALLVAIVAESVFCWMLAGSGALGLAAAQALTALCLWSAQIAYAWRVEGILFLPLLRSRSQRAAAAPDRSE